LAFALHLLVDFDLKIPALAMIVATVGALVTAGAWPPRVRGAPPVPGRIAAILIAAAVAAAAFVWILPKYRAEEARRSAREEIDVMARTGADVSREGEKLSAISGRLTNALILDPSNAQTWSDKAYSDSLMAIVY